MRATSVWERLCESDLLAATPGPDSPPWLVCLLAVALPSLSACTTAEPVVGANQSCNTVVITGYWPPSNEMLRHWSPSAAQNPEGWQGENWESLGYDVYSFFPEFPPDGDPVGDPIGSAGSVGSAESDLRVDYQDTSPDFWRIVERYRPRILITTSRGGDIDWELEALEGGHASDAGPAEDWASDRHGDHTLPTEATIDSRSWEAISTWRRGRTLPSQLPLERIEQATRELDIAQVEIDRQGTSGNYLSGFMGLHGLYHESISDHTVAAGHIHVGRTLDPVVARQLVETTLRVVLEQHPPVACGEAAPAR